MPVLVRSDDGVGVRASHRSFDLFLVTAVMSLTSILIYLVRMIQRLYDGRKLGWDDLAITISLFFNTLLGVTSFLGVKYGYGLHQLQLGGYDEFVARLTFYLEQIFYKGSLNCTKLSMLFMYLRVFPYRRFRKVSETMIWIIAIYAWASIIVTIVQCVPLAKIFDHSVEGGCINVTSFWLANANFNLLSDLIILIMPIPLILGLQVARSPKFGLYIIFGLGFFVCAITIIRMTPLEMTSKDPDVTFGSYNSTYWSVVESNLAIMCASLPTWKYVLGKLFPCMFPSQEERRSYGFIPARRRTHGNHRGNWLGRLASRNHTYNLSGGLFGNSNVSQASSQAPIIASVPAARQRSPGFRAVPYDSTVSAGEPSTGHETPELDFDIPNGDAGRLHGQDATKRDAKPAPYPTTDDDDEDFMAVLKDPEVRGYDTMADSQ